MKQNKAGIALLGAVGLLAAPQFASAQLLIKPVTTIAPAEQPISYYGNRAYNWTRWSPRGDCPEIINQGFNWGRWTPTRYFSDYAWQVGSNLSGDFKGNCERALASASASVAAKLFDAVTVNAVKVTAEAEFNRDGRAKAGITTTVFGQEIDSFSPSVGWNAGTLEDTIDLGMMIPQLGAGRSIELGPVGTGVVVAFSGSYELVAELDGALHYKASREGAFVDVNVDADIHANAQGQASATITGVGSGSLGVSGQLVVFDGSGSADAAVFPWTRYSFDSEGRLSAKELFRIRRTLVHDVNDLLRGALDVKGEIKELGTSVDKRLLTLPGLAASEKGPRTSYWYRDFDGSELF